MVITLLVKKEREREHKNHEISDMEHWISSVEIHCQTKGSYNYIFCEHCR
jgi:hypothetical protein